MRPAEGPSARPMNRVARPNEPIRNRVFFSFFVFFSQIEAGLPLQ